MRITKIVCLVVMTLAIQGSEVGCRQKQQPVCKEFFALSLEQQETIFRTFPLDRQLEIFRCGMYRRPPEIALAYEIAKGGEKIVPALTEELRNEKDEWMQNAIIDIFRVMSNKGYLRGKTAAIQQIRDTVSSMKTFRIKKEAEESLKEIEANASSSNNN
jgi:hypothetical protein